MIKYINDNNYFIAQLLIFCYNLSRSIYMDYSIKINEFEGPLDLLLHLIKEANIDIQDISINEITNQYLDYPIIWYPLGIYVLFNPSFSHSS